jgi:WD40 repeat protein
MACEVDIWYRRRLLLWGRGSVIIIGVTHPILVRMARLTSCFALLLYLVCFAYAQTTPTPVGEMLLVSGIGSGRIENLSFSPDGKSLLVLTNIGFRILDVQSGRVVNSIASYARASSWRWEDSPVAICWSNDGKQIARASREIEIWSPLGKTPERTLPISYEDAPLSDLVWSPSGDQIAARTSQPRIVVIDVRSGRRVLIPEKWEEDGSTVFALKGPSWSPDGRLLAVLVGRIGNSAASESIHIWDMSRLALVRDISLTGLPNSGHGRETEDSMFIQDRPIVAWAPDGKVLAADSGKTGLLLWDARTGKFLRQLGQGNQFLSWSRDGAILHVVADDQVRFINRGDGIATVATQNEDILQGQTVVSADGRYIAAIVDRRRPDEVDLWRAGTKKPFIQIPWTGAIHMENYGVDSDNTRIGMVWPSQVSPNGNQLAVSKDGATEILDSMTGRQAFAPSSPRVWIAWSPSGNLIVVDHAGAGDTRLIRANSGQPISQFAPSGFVAFSPSEDLIASGGAAGVRVLRVNDGTVVETIDDVRRRHFHAASWSPNGRMILLDDFGDDAGSVEPAVFSLTDKALKPAPPGRGRLLWIGPDELVRTTISGGIFTLQSPNRQLAVTIPQTGASELWDLRAGKTAAGPPQAGFSSVWSPDSTRIASMSGPGKIDVWDVAAHRVTETWYAPGAEGATTLLWPEKLTLVENIGGAVRVWRQP